MYILNVFSVTLEPMLMNFDRNQAYHLYCHSVFQVKRNRRIQSTANTNV